MPIGGFGGAAAATAVLRITADTRGANQSLGNRGLGGSLKSLVPSAKTAALGIAGIGVAGAAIGVKLVSGLISAGDGVAEDVAPYWRERRESERHEVRGRAVRLEP